MTIASGPIDGAKGEAKHLLETPSMAAEMKAMQDSLKANNIQTVGGRATRSARSHPNRAAAAQHTPGPRREAHQAAARQEKERLRGKPRTKG